MANHELKSLARKMAAHDASVFGDLEQAATQDAALAAETAWSLITEVDGRGVPDFCTRLYMFLQRLWGQADLEKRLKLNWAILSEIARINVCYAAQNPDAMRTEFALELFYLPEAAVHDRHLIAAGLAQTESIRKCKRALQEILAKIGTYENANQQKTLQAFLKKAKAAL